MTALSCWLLMKHIIDTMATVTQAELPKPVFFGYLSVEFDRNASSNSNTMVMCYFAAFLKYFNDCYKAALTNAFVSSPCISPSQLYSHILSICGDLTVILHDSAPDRQQQAQKQLASASTNPTFSACRTAYPPASKTLDGNLHTFSGKLFYIYNINSMLKYIPALMLLHAGYSLMKWRQFLLLENQANNFYVPTDIMVELIVATILCLIVIVSRVANFQQIRDLSCQYTYDSAFWQPRFNNMNIMNSRAPAISSLVKSHLTSLPQL